MVEEDVVEEEEEACTKSMQINVLKCNINSFSVKCEYLCKAWSQRLNFGLIRKLIY